MLGLFSSRLYKSGELLLEIKGEVISHPVRTSIQVGPGKHVDVVVPVKFINHSCRPNTKVEGEKILALREIYPGDEITFDYQATEEKLSDPFICRDCGGWVKGSRFRGENRCLSGVEQKIKETQ